MLRRQEGGTKPEWALTSDGGGSRHFQLQTLLSSTLSLGAPRFMNLAAVSGYSDQLPAKLCSPSPLCSRCKERSGSEKCFSLTLLVGEDVSQYCYLKKSPLYFFPAKYFSSTQKKQSNSLISPTSSSSIFFLFAKWLHLKLPSANQRVVFHC